MQFLQHKDGITDVDSWGKKCPPMGGKTQWKDGRSAKELARYMTANLPALPREIEDVLSNFCDADATFSWDAEYVTDFAGCKVCDLGIGNGRNHDAILYNDSVFVGIEGKADEPFGNDLVGEAYTAGSNNKKKRIEGLVSLVFGDDVQKHASIRYQLLTATAATLLEAKERTVENAVFLAIVFRSSACKQANLEKNQADVDVFLCETGAKCTNGIWEVPTAFGSCNGIRLFFQKIEIDI